ncbi:MAG TPA: NTP transferase domain-containing protein [Rhizomicrobium sp.]|nr:NTP transferase domain-containing protein [Rhizomicrobium sp.]
MPDISPTIAVIQARMGSSRLPGKVLMPIAGQPLLWHIVHRLGYCRHVDGIVIATSTDPSDDAIEAFCRDQNILCVRGSLDNVLDRYRLAAERSGARTLLRVTGDTPLVDPGFVDYLVTAMIGNDGDFAVIEPGALCAHEGVDVFSRRALDWLLRHAADDPVAREHVTSYFKLRPGGVKVVTVPAYAPLAVAHERFSIDTVDDLTLIRAVYDRLGAAPGELKLADALKLLGDEPSWRQINAHVRQKSISQVERHALICCQGGSKAGLGHVRRTLSLARALRDSQGFGVVVGIHGDEDIADLIRAASFETVRLERDQDLQALAGTRKFSLGIVDVKDWLTRGDVATLARNIPVIAVIDDISDRRLAASHAYYPPIPQAGELAWAGSACKPRIGWEWCILGFDPARLAAPDKRAPGQFRIAISMGGADPLNLTATALEALDLIKPSFQADFVIGPAFADPKTLIGRIEKAGPNFHALTNVSDLVGLFANADLALIAFGVTAYEVAALGVPAIYLPISQDHLRSASAFVSAGLGLALPEAASAYAIAAAVSSLMEDDARRRDMHLTGPKLITGGGAAKIAADLADAVAKQSQPVLR